MKKKNNETEKTKNNRVKMEFVGVKKITAEPMNKLIARNYGLLRENPKSLLSTDDAEKYETIDGYKMIYPDGYESWSPKDVFEKSYFLNQCLSGGLALHYALAGYMIRRKFWPQAFVTVHKGYDTDQHMMPIGKKEKAKKDIKAPLFQFNDMLVRTDVYADPLIPGKTNVHHSAWTPTVDDILAEDWFIMQPEEDDRTSEKIS
jgi:hypothetical protein